MPVLEPHEYDASYFDGATQSLAHNAGYGHYRRWRRNDAAAGFTGEFYSDLVARLAQSHSLANKNVLEIGCAKGFVVEDLRALGINAHGIDVSSYAIGEAAPAVAPFVSVGNALTDLGQYRNNEWDVVFSLRVLECFDDADIPALVSELNRISKKQFHLIDDVVLNADFYNLKSLSEWQAFDWANQTRIVSYNTWEEVVK